MQENRNILCFVYKATSELDFLIPLLWKIRKDRRDIEISVVYCVLDKQKILRGSKFYSELFEKIGVREYDLSAFIAKSISKIVRLVFSKSLTTSYWDQQHLIKYRRNRFIRYTQPYRYLSKFFDYFISMLIRPHVIFSKINPDMIFFAHRSYQFPGKEKIVKYIYYLGKKVALFPHGPFNSIGWEELRFGERRLNTEIPLPSFCEYWYSLIEEETAKYYPKIDKQIIYVGYPGLDQEWLNYLRHEYGTQCNNEKQSDDVKIYKCLLIVRKFEMNADDYGVLEYGEFLELINSVVTVFKNCGHKIHIIIKPHPSNDYVGLKKIMQNVGYEDWEISAESNYRLMPVCDFVLAVPSTSFLAPVMFGLPVILLKTSFLDQMQSAWKFMGSFFYGSKFLVKDQSSLKDMLNIVLKILEGGESAEREMMRENVRHFRQYYPDHALNMCMEHINNTIST